MSFSCLWMGKYKHNTQRDVWIMFWCGLYPTTSMWIWPRPISGLVTIFDRLWFCLNVHILCDSQRKKTNTSEYYCTEVAWSRSFSRQQLRSSHIQVLIHVNIWAQWNSSFDTELSTWRGWNIWMKLHLTSSYITLNTICLFIFCIKLHLTFS